MLHLRAVELLEKLRTVKLLRFEGSHNVVYIILQAGHGGDIVFVSVFGGIHGPGTAVAEGTASVKVTIGAGATHTFRLEGNGGDSATPALLFATTSGSIY